MIFDWPQSFFRKRRRSGLGKSRRSVMVEDLLFNNIRTKAGSVATDGGRPVSSGAFSRRIYLLAVAVWGIFLLMGCTSPNSEASHKSAVIQSNSWTTGANAGSRHLGYQLGHNELAHGRVQPVPRVILAQFTPRECPPIRDQALIIARVSAAKSDAPRTQHPGVDLFVYDGVVEFVLRIHFGDRGDGKNSCLPFDECPNMNPLPGAYPVDTKVVKEFLAYLKRRDYTVGKFSSWGIPILPWFATGSNCGDAFLQTVERLGIGPQARQETQKWIQDIHGGKWAYERGKRRPVDEFYHPDEMQAASVNLTTNGLLPVVSRPVTEQRISKATGNENRH